MCLGLVIAGVAGLGCSGRPAVQGANADPVQASNITLPAAQLYVLETWGTPPEDTTLVFSTRGARTVVLRHAPPDNTVFAELEIPMAALPDSSADSVHLSIAIRPGLYGVTVTSTPAFKPGAVLRFKYAVHFAAPVAASQKYGNPALFERALAVAVEQKDGQFKLLPSTRPAADNLAATIPGPGVYMVAAPR
ncbi:MAG: hypothetical protein ABI613_05775 [Gemmatimonadota bacterium]